MSKEKIAIVSLSVLVIVFLFAWAGKSKQPVVNDITTVNYAENVSGTMWWQEEKKTTIYKDNSVPDGYIKVPGEDNLYMVVDSNNNVKEYVLRTILEDGSSNWEIFNENISSVMTHVEGDVYKYINEDEVMYFRYNENDDGTYNIEHIKDYEENTDNTVKEERVRETKIEDGFTVVYETVIYTTYNSAGELINTRTEGPNVVSKTKDESTSDAKKEWIDGVYASTTGSYDYRDEISNILQGLVNTKRQELGTTAISSQTGSVEELIAKVVAADLLKNNFNYESNLFKELKLKFPHCNLLTLTVPHPVGDSDKTIAKFIQDKFNENEDACKIRYSSQYTNAGICVVNTNEGYLIVEAYNY